MDTVINRWRRSLRKATRFLYKNDSLGEPMNTLDPKSDQQSCTNILIIVENMSYTYDTRVQNIVKTLKKAGNHIFVICPRYSGDPKKLKHDGLDVRFYYLPPYPNGFLGYLAEYIYSFSIISVFSLVIHFRQRIDILHACNPPDFFSPLGRLFQLFNSHFIYDKHDCVPELFEERFGYKSQVIYKLLRKAEKLTENTADHILTTNESTKRNVIIKNQIAEDCVTVVRNAPDLKKFPTDTIVPFDRKTIEVGYVGNMNPQDCIDLLLKSVHYIKFVKGRTDIQFILIGNGSAYEDLTNMSRNLNIDDIVEFTGRLHPSKVYLRLASVDICVQPDQKNDFTDSCTMVKDLEYMALAKPIVAFDLVETRYSCDKAALYAKNNSHEDFARQIIKLAEEPEIRAYMGELGRKRLYEQFTWSHSEKQLLKAYEIVKLNRQGVSSN